MVFDNHIANLGHLLVTVLRIRGKAKTIRANYSACMKSAMRADDTIRINLYTGMKGSVVSNDHVVADIYLRVYLNVVADFHIVANVCKGANIAILTQH